MKKMMAVFFFGCTLIGAGIGISLMEFSKWKVSEIRTDLLELPVKHHSEEISIDMDSINEIEINSRYQYSNSYTAETEIIADSTLTDSLFIEIDYQGLTPNVYQSSWWEDNDGNIYAAMWIDTDNYRDLSDLYSLIKYMFDNKTYFPYGETAHINKITVRTAYPDKIILQ